ncbi:MAG: TerB family tellurite resistance protein [Bacteroidales bacterium]
MSNLNELKKSILADGIIDEQEVNKLREVLYEDGKIDKEEAEFIFELNDAVSGKENHPSWRTLFVDSITDFLLEDNNSPGVVDEDEAKWLLEKIQGDGNLDKLELALLQNLKNKAKQLPTLLTNLLN